jgi:hypothetical protein
LIAFLLVPASIALSQGIEDENPGPPPREFGGQAGRDDQQIRKQLEQIKIWQMTKEMNLPTGKAEKFFPLYNEYNNEMRGITAERRQMIRSLDSAVTGNMAESEISKRIRRILTLDDQLAATHVKFINSLGAILSPTEVARYMVFEQRFDREIRDRVRMMMRRRMGGPEPR